MNVRLRRNDPPPGDVRAIESLFPIRRLRRPAIRLAALAASIFCVAAGVHAQSRGIVAAPIPGGGAPPVMEDRYALLIGNSEYDGNAFRRLDGVRYDVDAVAEVLLSHGYEVELLRDLPSDRMGDEIERFIKRNGQRKNSSIVFYYAGHGVSVPNIAGVEQGYLVPVDTPSPAADSTAFLNALLPIYEFGNYAQRMQARHALFLFDACFAGTIFKDLGLERDDTPPPAVADLLARPARSVITSGSAGQKVPDESLFRLHLVRALNGEAGSFGDGFLTGEELGSFLRATVMNEGGGQQRPQFGKLMLAGLAEGDFVFSLSAIARSASAAKAYRRWLDDTRDTTPQLKKAEPSEKSLYLFMQMGFGAAEEYDADENLLAEDRMNVWKVFLDAFSEDLGAVTEDDTMRETAIERYDHWRKLAK